MRCELCSAPAGQVATRGPQQAHGCARKRTRAADPSTLQMLGCERLPTLRHCGRHCREAARQRHWPTQRSPLRLHRPRWRPSRSSHAVLLQPGCIRSPSRYSRCWPSLPWRQRRGTAARPTPAAAAGRRRLHHNDIGMSIATALFSASNTSREQWPQRFRAEVTRERCCMRLPHYCIE